MKGSKISWFLFALLFFAIIFLLGVVLMKVSPPKDQQHAPFSAENPKPEGLKALYRFYQVRGYEVKLWKKPYQQLPKTQGDLLMIVGPQVKGPNDQEMQAIFNWIREGNRLILWAPIESEWTRRFEFEGVSCIKSYKRRVYSIEEKKWFQKTKQINWPSGQCVLPAKDHQDVLVDDQYSTLMIKKKVGKGEIYYTPETEILMNQQIDQEDHMQLLLGIAELSSKTIWFDESIHPLPQPFNQADQQSTDESQSEPPPSVLDYLHLDGWLAVTQILLFAFLFLYQKGKRFAKPRKEWKQEKRDSLEYVEAMARWYERSKLRKEVYEEFRNRLNHELMQTFRIPKQQFSVLGLEKMERFLGQEYQRRYRKWVLSDELGRKRRSSSFFVQGAMEILRLRKELREWKDRRSK